jgi:hypothetical protein
MPLPDSKSSWRPVRPVAWAIAAMAMATQLLVGTPTALAAETENASRTATGGFAYPVSTANRRFIDQTGKVFLLRTMSSWAMSQNCSNAEITQALEGLKALDFNAVTVSPLPRRGLRPAWKTKIHGASWGRGSLPQCDLGHTARQARMGPSDGHLYPRHRHRSEDRPCDSLRFSLATAQCRMRILAYL